MTHASTPAKRWARYRSKGLTDDLVAAVVVAMLLVPQSLAYALLAGLPPIAGVMASLLPVLAYAALGSSSTLAVGPVAVLAMMTAQIAVPTAAQFGIDVHLVALVLAVEIGAALALAALLRLEVLAALISAPVIHGFISGAAIAIALGQLPSLLGLVAGGTTLPDLLSSWAAAERSTPHAATAAIGALALLFLWGTRRYGARVIGAFGVGPRAVQLLVRLAPMMVLIATVAWVALLPQSVEGVARVGAVDLREGLRIPPLWAVPAPVWVALAVPALLLGLVAYVESLAISEALAARRGERIVPRRELLGLAAANAAAGVSGGMPVTGGFARSIVAFDAGARTRMAGVFAALLLAATVLLLGHALALLPKAVLAATIVVAVLSLLEPQQFVVAWRYSRAEFCVMVLVAALTVLIGVEVALLTGVLVAAALLLQRTARPHWAEVGRLPGTDVFRNVRRFEVETLPHVLTVRIDEGLLFTNSRWLADTLLAQTHRPGLRHFVLMMSGINDVDLSGLQALEQLMQELAARGIKLHLSEVKGPVRDRLDAVAFTQRMTGSVFRSQAEAYGALAADASGTPP
jgi:SulP family sulfate permease